MHLKAHDIYLFTTSSSDAQNSTVTSTFFHKASNFLCESTFFFVKMEFANLVIYTHKWNSICMKTQPDTQCLYLKGGRGAEVKTLSI